MPQRTLNAPRRALVLIDVQQEYFGGPLDIQYPPRDASLANILRALDAAAQADVPVVAVQHEYPEGAPVFVAGSAGRENHPEVERRIGSTAKRVVKSHSDVFASTGLAEWFRENGIDTLTLVGCMTNNCGQTEGGARPQEPEGRIRVQRLRHGHFRRRGTADEQGQSVRVRRDVRPGTPPAPTHGARTPMTGSHTARGPRPSWGHWGQAPSRRGT
ncbi:isochorismatase family protein [Streptomyces sp. NPDC057433]|uniref:isochorismatase family protein n=1 Tax=Streptomyces sp. NPDC057433 TaxID=3346132 RepID=UPI00367FB2DE